MSNTKDEFIYKSHTGIVSRLRPCKQYTSLPSKLEVGDWNIISNIHEMGGVYLDSVCNV